MVGCSCCSDWCRQFWLMLWKNTILQIRRPIGTVFELVSPALAVLLVVILRLTLFVKEEQCFSVFQSQSLQLEGSRINLKVVYYTPNNTDHNQVAALAQSILTGTEFIGVSSVDRLTSLVREISTSSNQTNYTSVVFPTTLNGSDITLTLRPPHEVGNANTWNTRRTGPTFSPTGPTTSNLYFNEGFVHVQNALTRALITWRMNQSEIRDPLPRVLLKQLPFPKYTRDTFLSGVVSLLPIVLAFSYLYSGGVFVKELVLEKESRLRESMKMMGLKSSALFSAWFVKQFLFMMISGFVAVILIKFGGIFPASGFFLLLIYFILYFISFISFGYMISSFFSSARLSLYVGFILYFVAFVPYFFLFARLDQIPLIGKIVASLLFNTGAGLGFNIISALELSGSGLQWTNAANPQSVEDPFNVAIIFGMFILDSILYFIIGWYKEAVFPGKYGVPKPFYFPFLPSYWLGRPMGQNKVKAMKNTVLDDAHLNQNRHSAHEPEPSNLICGISIRGLSKVYRTGRTKKLAVNDLSLNMYEGQITALLGHNGAGKTTTMSVLTGLYTPTSGDAVINGYSILTDMDGIRKSLGLCPQHNVLFDRLTVKEHLMLFGMLKGVGWEKLKKEVVQFIQDLQIEDKTKTIAAKLSGGMKRKLSVAIALIGGSRFVILDEPTSGMDPYARRSTWDLLAKYKKDRTILLTTHHMDEADILGDRIAIMAEGKLLTSGTPLFLKSRFGVGYHLTVVKGEDCISEVISDIVLSQVDGSQKVTEAAAEMSFILPSSSISQFPALFDRFDANKQKLGISSYGLSVTTMEEVFMKVGEESGEFENFLTNTRAERYSPPETEASLSTVTTIAVDKDNEVQEATICINGDENGAAFRANPTADDSIIRPSLIMDNDRIESREEPISINSGIVLWFQQFFAMFIKRALNAIRHIVALVFQLVLPLVFVILSVALLRVLRSPLAQDEQRELSLSLSLPITGARRMFFGDSINSSVPSSYFANSNFEYEFTEMLNVVPAATDIMNGVSTIGPSNMTDCCSYDYQILDKYCASLDTTVYENTLSRCSSHENFGYRHCFNCMSCCESSFSPTCPGPPRVLYNDPDDSGSLDDFETYITEHILRIGSMNVDQYEREWQIGFTVDAGVDSSFALCISNLPGIPDPTQLLPSPNMSNATISQLALDLCTNNSLLWLTSSFALKYFNAPFDIPQENITATVWYNNENYHVAPAALNTFYNHYLTRVADTYNFTGTLPRITVVNHPLPRTAQGEVDQLDRVFAGFTLSFFMSFGFAFLLASFVLFVAQERSSKAKHLQFVGGVHISSFWLATFLWDLLNCLPPVILTIIIFAAARVEEFSGANLGLLTLLLVLLCWSGIPLIYCFSFLFNNHLVAFASSVALVFFIPMFGSLVRAFVAIENQDTAEILDYIFMIFPVYAFNRGLENIYTNEIFRETCTRDDFARRACEDGGVTFLDSTLDSIESPGIGANIVFLCFEGILLFILTLFIERGFYVHEIIGMLNCRKHEPHVSLSRAGEDIDVANERKRVNQVSVDDVVVIKNLSKTYQGDLTNCWTKKKKAVDEICLGIHKQECFGLLGVNGAGKTSTFNMLTGDLRPTSGTALIADYDILTQLRKVQQRIGYCPQFDALLERMTGEELLTMFCRLRGIPEKTIPFVVKTEIKRLDLEKYAKKRCGTYSGGNKRKLSTAIALVGSPPIILLDEPTTGMDPTARRHLWNALTDLVASGKSIVLTSHSMEECEALCTRLAIMVNGEFKCLGSVQHLKSKFGKGLTLVVKTKPVAVNNASSSMMMANLNILDGANTLRPFSSMGGYVPQSLANFINNTFPGSVVLESHQGSTTYQLPTEGLAWSFILQQIETNKEVLGIEDYSISQTTLEQVFLTFAKEQLEE